jgi:hypothetical protein
VTLLDKPYFLSPEIGYGLDIGCRNKGQIQVIQHTGDNVKRFAFGIFFEQRMGARIKTHVDSPRFQALDG